MSNAKTRRLGRGLAVTLALLCASAVSAAVQMETLSYLRGRCPQGAVAWQNGGSGYNSESTIYVVDIATGSKEDLGRGSQPEFSPDGSKIAWISGSTAKGRMVRGADKAVRTIASGVSSGAGVHWVSNSEVVVVIGGGWKRVSLCGSQTDVPELTKLGTGGTEVDARLCGDGVWAYVTGTTWKTSDGKSGSTGGACSCSLSPDGKSVTGLQEGHNSCKLTSIRTGGISGDIKMTEADCGTKGFDNQRWSSNDDRFIVCQYECSNKLVVVERGTNKMIEIGSCTGEAYGDMSKLVGSGSPWPTNCGTTPVAKLVVSDNAVSFSADPANPKPASKAIDVYTDQGTLEGLKVGATPSWLAVTLSAASGKTVTATCRADATGLAANTYTSDVTVSSTNAGSATFRATLTVTAGQPVGPLIEVVAPNGGESYTVGQTVAVRWNGLKDSLPRGVDILISTDGGKSVWGVVSGTSSIDPSSASWGNYSWTIPATMIDEGTNEPVSLVSTQCVIKVRDYNEGSGVEDRSNAFFTIKAPLDPSALHLKFNCGGATFVPGWDDPAPYASGGTAFDFGTSFSTAGVTDAAPADVYRTCRHRVKGQETGFSYRVANVPDGTYTVRLHFGDNGTDRAIDVTIEGEEVISDLNVVAKAGANVALVIEKFVTVEGGDGITIGINDNRSTPGDVLINGFEIIAAKATNRTPGPSPHGLRPVRLSRLHDGSVAVSVAGGGPHAVEIRSADGREVAAYRGTGATSIVIDSRRVTPGAYVVIVGTAGPTTAERFTIVRQ